MRKTWAKMGLIVVLISIGMLWALAIVPYWQANEWFVVLHPVGQYLLYNAGAYVVVTGMYLVLYMVLRPRAQVRAGRLFLAGLGLFVLLEFTLNLWDAPLYLSVAGEATVTDAADLPFTSMGALLSYLYSLAGLTGAALFWTVYAVTPAVVLVVVAILVPALGHNLGGG